MVSINGLFSSVQEIKKDTYINDVKGLYACTSSLCTALEKFKVAENNTFKCQEENIGIMVPHSINPNNKSQFTEKHLFLQPLEAREYFKVALNQKETLKCAKVKR